MFYKKGFLEILQNLQGSTCARDSFLIKLQDLGSDTGVFLRWLFLMVYFCCGGMKGNQHNDVFIIVFPRSIDINLLVNLVNFAQNFKEELTCSDSKFS